MARIVSTSITRRGVVAGPALTAAPMTALAGAGNARPQTIIGELSPKVGDGGNRKGGISWGCLTPPLLHRRSDMPCPKITSSS